MNNNMQPITKEDFKAKCQALTPANRAILAQKLSLQLGTVENNREIAVLSFQDGTDQYSVQKAAVQSQIDILDSVINPVTP